MAVATVAADQERQRRPSLLGVGTVIWLASELMFFSGLFAAYFTLRSVNDAWPPDGVELETGRTALFTAILVASSFTMHGAVKAGERDDRRSAIRWLLITMSLGLVFLGNQGVEYAQADFTMGTHAYGSIFYLMTGFHGLHVIGGVLFMLAVMGVIGGSKSRARADETVDVCAYYWHFVDVVWVAMFTTIYLIR